MRNLFFLMLAAFLSSCVVTAPKYTGIEEVLQLKPGMTRDEVHKTLGIPPYDLKSADANEVIYIYKYRVTDRSTLPFLMNKTNGTKKKGKWVDLFIAFDNEWRVTSVASCSECETTKPTKQKLDINSLVLLLTVTIPAVLVYLGFSSR